MNASELSEAIKANPADFVGRLGYSIRTFLIEEVGSTDEWWDSYREPSKYGSNRWKQSGRFDPNDLDTWTKQEQENAKKFVNLNKFLTAATKVEDFVLFIDLNGSMVDPPRQISAYEKLYLTRHSGGCMGFLGEFAATFNFLCQLFIPKKSSANFEGFRELYDTCVAGSQWLEAIGSIPEALRVNLPRVDLVPDGNIPESQELNSLIGTLGSYDIQFLIAMLKLGATSPESKVTVSKIVNKISPSIDPNSGFKKCSPRLQKTHPPLVLKCKDRGFYLSSSGVSVAERLDAARKN